MSVELPIFKDWKCATDRPHCGSCRADRAFRRSAGEFYELPGGLVDFDCPYGIALVGEQTDEKQGEFKPPARADIAERAKGAGPTPLTPEQQQAIRDHAAKLEAQALPGAWERISKGIVGITKYTLGIDRSSSAMIESRTAICNECEHMAGGRCDLCGCQLHMKRSIAGEHCPAHKW